MPNVNVFELFAGCGGLGYGFHQEGFQIVSCNELEPAMGDTYKENYPETNVIVGDITNSKIKDKIYVNFVDKRCDVILGGPPCVAYSMAGDRNTRDKRGQLFRDYIEVVKHLNPKVFVMENVKGILTILHDKDNLTGEEKVLADKYYKLESLKLELQAKKKSINHKDKNIDEIEKIQAELKIVKRDLKKMDKDLLIFRKRVTDIIKETFMELGYKVEMKLLNSANYGVPQKRERVIFIGLRKDIDKEISYPEETHNKDGSNGKKKWVSVREAIDDLHHWKF